MHLISLLFSLKFYGQFCTLVGGSYSRDLEYSATGNTNNAESIMRANFHCTLFPCISSRTCYLVQFGEFTAAGANPLQTTAAPAASAQTTNNAPLLRVTADILPDDRPMVLINAVTGHLNEVVLGHLSDNATYRVVTAEKKPLCTVSLPGNGAERMRCSLTRARTPSIF